MGAVDTTVAVSQKSKFGEYERVCNEEFFKFLSKKDLCKHFMKKIQKKKKTESSSNPEWKKYINDEIQI